MVNLRNSLLLIVALAGVQAVPASAKTDPRAVAFTVFGTYVALGSLHSLIQKPLICESEAYEDEISISDKVIRQINRVLEKAGALYTFAGGSGLAMRASKDSLPGDASKATIAGSAIGALTMCAGYYLLKTQPSLICREKKEEWGHEGYDRNERYSSRSLRQINRILGKIGALGLIVLGGFIVANPNSR